MAPVFVEGLSVPGGPNALGTPRRVNAAAPVEPERDTSAPEPNTSAPEPNTSAPEPDTSAPDLDNAVPNPRDNPRESASTADGLTHTPDRPSDHDEARDPWLRNPSVEPTESEQTEAPAPYEEDERRLRAPLGANASEAARILRVDRVAVWRFVEPGDILRCVVRYHRREGTLAAPGPSGEVTAEGFRRVFEGGAPVSIEDATRDRPEVEPLRAWIATEGIRAFLAFPIHSEGRLRAFVTYEEDRGPRRWTPHAVELAAGLSRQIAATLAPSAPEVLPGPPPEADGDATVSPSASAPGDSEARITTEPERGKSSNPMSWAEGAALLAAEDFPELLQTLEVQRGYLRLLEEALAERPADIGIVVEARAAARRVEEGLEEFLHNLREGIGTRVPLELNQFLSGMIAKLAREAGTLVRLRVAPSADVIPVEADERMLERVLLHLVRNARVRAAPGSDIRVSWGRVYASGGGRRGEASEAGLARIRVEDHGAGIPPSEVSSVFDPDFSRSDTDRDRNGMGLAVVRAVIEGHGGWIEVKSRRGEGTVLDAYLPLSGELPEGIREARAVESVPRDETPEVEPHPASVLILEDEPLLARLLEQVLSRHGYRVEVATGPTEAERGWRGGKVGPDLVVMERVLSGGRSGEDLARRWRSEVPHLKVVMLDRRAAGDRPDSDAPEDFPILRRPFDPVDVLTRVKEEIGGVTRRAGRVEAPMSRSTTQPPESSGGQMIAH